MKQKRQFKNVRQFLIEEGVILQKDGTIIDFEGNIVISNPEIRYITATNNKIYLLDENQIIITDDLELQELTSNKSVKLFSGKSNYLILIDIFTNKEYLLSLSQKKIVMKDDFLGNIIWGDYLITCIQHKNYIKVSNLVSNNAIIFSLNSLEIYLDDSDTAKLKIMEFSGIFKNILVCTLNNGTILSIDIETGKMIKYFKDTGIIAGLYQKDNFNSIFVGLKHMTFVEIDIEESSVLRKVDIEPNLKVLMNIPENNVSWFGVGLSVYEDGLFYFYGDKNVLAVYDIKTQTILDHYVFKFEGNLTQLKGGKESLQLNGSSIFCLDTSGDLHEIEQ